MLFTQAAIITVLLVMLVIKSIPGFYIILMLFGFFFAMAYSNGIFHGSAGAVDRGRRMGLFESILTLGTMVGSIVGGYLFQYFSIYQAFILCAGIISAGLVVQLIILWIGKKHRLD